MSTNYRGKHKRKRLSPYTVAGMIIFCLVLSGTVAYKTITLKAQSTTYEKQIEQLREQKKKLDAEKEEIKEFKKHVKTDEYTEEVAREKLGLVHEGEIVFKPEKNK